MNDILVSDILIVDRARTDHEHLEELASNIQSVGLIQPIGLTPDPDHPGKYRVVFGGRRSNALKLTTIQKLSYGISAIPGQAGYVLVAPSDATHHRIIELAENFNRDDMDWRDVVRHLIQAWRAYKREKQLLGENAFREVFGSLLGVHYADMYAADKIYDQLIENEAQFSACTTARAALQIVLRRSTAELNKRRVELLHTAKVTKPTTPPPPPSSESDSPEERPRQLPSAEEIIASMESDEDEPSLPTITIPLSEMIYNENGLDLLSRFADKTFDHIITDPDYAISSETLCAGAAGASAGIWQSSVEESLADLRRLIDLAWLKIKDRGWFIFFYDLDHHNYLQDYCRKAGFRVQSWPIVIRKQDYRANTAPTTNFPKNLEYAMVCGKPGASLNRAQSTSVFDVLWGQTTTEFGHPFAKPVVLWQYLLSAVTIEGSLGFEPFLGSGSFAAACIDSNVRFIGAEINEAHFHTAVINIRRAFEKKNKTNHVKFT